jgi:hypothetical protein
MTNRCRLPIRLILFILAIITIRDVADSDDGWHDGGRLMGTYRFSLRSAMLDLAGLALLMAVITLLVSVLGIRGITGRIQGADLIVDVYLINATDRLLPAMLLHSLRKHAFLCFFALATRHYSPRDFRAAFSAIPLIPDRRPSSASTSSQCRSR